MPAGRPSTRQTDEEKPKRRQSAAQIANLTGGSRKGIPNKHTMMLKDMILGALDKAGGEKYLLKQASENPTSFLTLVGKVLPIQVAGDPNNPPSLEVRHIYIAPALPSS